MAVVDLSGRLLGGRYRVLRKLGEGGMGAVYEAFDERNSFRVAVKVLSGDESAAAILRFEREARAAGALAHPNIVRIIDFRPADPMTREPPLLVMERLSGVSMRDLIRRGPLSVERTVEIARQVLDALALAHQAGIVHRDIKPANIVIDIDAAGGERAVLVDFGAAKLADGHKLTAVGVVVGTLAYMPPECVLELPLDGRTDLYALALCMYVALVGRNPLMHADPKETVDALLAGRYTPLRKARLDVPPRLSAIIEKGMSRDREQRYRTAHDMAASIDAWIESESQRGGASLSPISVGELLPARTLPFSKKTLAIAGVGLMAAAAALLLAFGASHIRAEREWLEPSSHAQGTIADHDRLTVNAAPEARSLDSDSSKEASNSLVDLDVAASPPLPPPVPTIVGGPRSGADAGAKSGAKTRERHFLK